MGFFERYLSLWVGLCIVAGVLLGNLFPGAFAVMAWQCVKLRSTQIWSWQPELGQMSKCPGSAARRSGC